MIFSLLQIYCWGCWWKNLKSVGIWCQCDKTWWCTFLAHHLFDTYVLRRFYCAIFIHVCFVGPTLLAFESFGLVWVSAVAWRCSLFIIWTGWTLAVALSYDDSTINIIVVIIISIIIRWSCSCFDSALLCPPKEEACVFIAVCMYVWKTSQRVKNRFWWWGVAQGPIGQMLVAIRIIIWMQGSWIWIAIHIQNFFKILKESLFTIVLL